MTSYPLYCTHILPPDGFNVAVLFPPNGGCLPTRSHIKRLEHWKTLPLLPKTSRELESESLLQVYFAIFEYSNLDAYMQKTCDVAEKAILAKINLRKKCVNRDKM